MALPKLKLKKMTTSQKIVYMTMFVICTAICAIHISIFIVGFLQGLKTHTEAVLNPFKLPKVWHWENYIDAFTLLEVKGVTFLEMTFNSCWYAIGSTVLSLIGTFMITYVIAKYKFPGSELLNTIAVLVLIIPLYGGGGAGYKLMYKLNLVNSPLYLVAKFGTITGQYLVMKAFIDGLSWSYAEAAFIDGASDFRVMWTINFPQLVSPLMAIVLNMFMATWNEFQNPLLFLSDMPLVSVGIYLFKTDMVYKVRMDILYAATCLAVVPIWILYGILNKSLLNLTFGGGIKG